MPHHSLEGESARLRNRRRQPRAPRPSLASGPAVTFSLALAVTGLATQTQCTHVAGLEELTFDGAGLTGAWFGWGGDGGGGTGGDGGDETGGGGTAGCGNAPTPPAAVCPETICNNGCSGPATCHINCAEAGNTQCADNEVTCPAGFNCVVECGVAPGCAGTEIFCPDTYNCLVRCNEADTCFNTEVECAESGTCEMECSSSQTACSAALLTCGQNSCHASCEGSSEPAVVCNDSCDCQDCS
jgi:hypothetical protein